MRAGRSGISAHVGSGPVDLGGWRHDTCVGTVRLLPSEVASPVAGPSERVGLARAPQAVADPLSDEQRRLRLVEQRFAGPESRLAPGPRGRVVADDGEPVESRGVSA